MAGDRVVWHVPTLHLIMAIAVHIQMPAQARLYATSRSRRTVESRGYAPHVTVFSMNRPERHLHRYLSLDATGRLHSGISRINPYSALFFVRGQHSLLAPFVLSSNPCASALIPSVLHRQGRVSLGCRGSLLTHRLPAKTY